MSAKELPKYVNGLLDQVAKENGFCDYSVQINRKSLPGDGFSSEIFSVIITENKSDKTLAIVCKTAPFNKIHRKEFHSVDVFNREALFYTTLMPIFAKFQEEKGLARDDQFLCYPKCYATIIDDDNEEYVIVLEDLRPSGFKMWDKSMPSPIENARLVMRELGKFHGLSVAMKDQRPDIFAKFKQIKDILKAFCRSENMTNMLKNAYDRAINSLKSEDHKNIMQHIENNIPKYMDNAIDDEARFGVLCHGDCWNNNLLYRFNDQGSAEDIRFLDWQVIRYVSPAIDLLYNIFTSTDKALRDKEYDNLLQCYHESLSKTVKLLGSNPDKLFTMENLKDELKRCGNYALLLSPLIIQISQADSSEISNLDEMFDKMAEGDSSKTDLITGLSSKGQLEYDRRINEVFEDIVKLGYYQKIN